MKTMRLIRLSLLVGALAIASIASAADRVVKIQPILAANTDGSGLSPDLSYAAYVNKIYAQANIRFEFLPSYQLNDTTYNSFDYNNAFSLVTDPGHGQSIDPLVINCFFVNSVLNESVYGFGYIDQPYAVMDTSLISGYSALGRVDTFAHEIGHVLGLEHTDTTNPSTPDITSYLMASGGIRNVPQALGDVYPDGDGLDRLLQSEIDIIRNSQFAQAAPVPEPATMTLLGLGVVATLRKRRRNKA